MTISRCAGGTMPNGAGRSARRILLTVDLDTAADDFVKIRNRDPMVQERNAFDRVQAYRAARLVGC